jgi:diguanylate cyclase (GGDEF)-like protein
LIAGSGALRTEVAPASGWVADFDELAGEVLALLAERVGLRLWLVTRVVEDRQLVVVSHYDAAGGYGLPAGSVLSWPTSLCWQLVAGHGPQVAPRVAAVPSYAAAAAGLPARVAAYVGVPLRRPDGALFGTLCGFDPEPQSDALLTAEPLVRLQARLLATVLAHALAADDHVRRAERAEAEASIDALTGLANRRAWDRVVGSEEARCRRYGHPACVLAVDLDGLKDVNDTHGHAAGDEVLRRAGHALKACARDSDLAARVGGDEFAVLAVETDAVQGARQADRLRTALNRAGVPATVGLGVRSPDRTLTEAWRQADQNMYETKRGSAGNRPRPAPRPRGSDPSDQETRR